MVTREKILSIEETTWPSKEYKWSGMDGWIIKTDKQDIKVGIDNGQSCCETWGYFVSEGDPQEFVGAYLLDVKHVDSCLNVERMKEECHYLSVEDCVFVNIETSEGTFQLTVYNEHNGYYSHLVVIESEQHSDDFYL